MKTGIYAAPAVKGLSGYPFRAGILCRRSSALKELEKINIMVAERAI